jgi:DNA repair protein RecO (recombination protein O)
VSFEGIIIKMHPSGEADLVLRVLRAEGDKLSLLAKNARRSKRRFGSSFDLFDRGRFETGRGRGTLLLVQSFIPGVAWRTMRADLDRYISASVLCETADYLVPEGVEPDSSASYTTVIDGLQAIEEAADSREALRAVYLAVANLLSIAGFLDQTLAQTPSANFLRRLLDNVEEITERKLQSRESLEQIIKGLKSSQERADEC